MACGEELNHLTDFQTLALAPSERHGSGGAPRVLAAWALVTDVSTPMRQPPVKSIRKPRGRLRRLGRNTVTLFTMPTELADGFGSEE